MIAGSGWVALAWALDASGANGAGSIAALTAAVSLTGLLSVLTAMQAWRQYRRQKELALLETLSHCANPLLGLEHSLTRLRQALQESFQATGCTLELPETCAAPAGQLGSNTSAPQSHHSQHRICVTVPWSSGQARLSLSRQRPWSASDERLLREIARSTFGLLQRIEQLDRLASQMAQRERQRLALDLHDRALQPYIGLKLALEGLHLRTDHSHPVHPALAKIIAMTEQTIGDLRGQIGAINTVNAPHQSLPTELQSQADHLSQLHGVHIDVQAHTALPLSQRLQSEITQMVREGLSNIRKHTSARSGTVHLHCDSQWLGLQIANEGLPKSGFMPRSISQRARALGGHTQVRTEPGGRTTVHVHIPV